MRTVTRELLRIEGLIEIEEAIKVTYQRNERESLCTFAAHDFQKLFQLNRRTYLPQDTRREILSELCR